MKSRGLIRMSQQQHRQDGLVGASGGIHEDRRDVLELGGKKKVHRSSRKKVISSC